MCYLYYGRSLIGGVCIFIHESPDCKVRKDLYINCDGIESLSIEIRKRKTRNTIFNVVYSSPNGDLKISEQFCKDLFYKKSENLKNMILAGDFNINALDYEQNKKVQSFFNLMYRYNMIPTINKPTRVGKNSATAIDHIIANCIVDCQFKTAILKTDVTDHFRIAMTLKTDEPVHQSQKVQNVHSRNYDEKAIESFNQRLREYDWAELYKCEDPNEAYKHFFETFISVYDNFFPKVKVQIKTKSLQSHWITKGIPKSSKRKQKLYEKYLKRRTNDTETAYKLYKNLFESIKRRAKQNYYSEKLLRFKYN